MNRPAIILYAVLSILMLGCEKADIAPLELVNDCNGNEKYLSADIDGDEFCASSSLLVAMNGELNVTGISGINTTLQLQFSSIDVGSHELNDASNSVLLINNSGSWVTPDTLAGMLNITAHDTIAQLIAGNFNAILQNTSGTAVVPVTAQFDLAY